MAFHRIRATQFFQNARVVDLRIGFLPALNASLYFLKCSIDCDPLFLNMMGTLSSDGMAGPTSQIPLRNCSQVPSHALAESANLAKLQKILRQLSVEEIGQGSLDVWLPQILREAFAELVLGPGSP